MIGTLSPTVSPGDIQPPLILTIDMGTSAVRVGLFDRLGRSVKAMVERVPLPIRTAADGAAEADADTLRGLTFDCLDRVLARAGPLASEIVAVAGCTFVGNVLGVDGEGRAVTPLTTYADTRAADEVPRLRRDLDEATTHDRTGCHFHPAYLPARLRWYAREQPVLFRRVARWVSIGEYLELELFGETAVSTSVASWTGLLDRRRLAWDEPLLSELPITAANLSQLTDAGTPRRGLRPAYARRWPVLADVPWYPALGDGAAANIGSGCISPSRVALTVGSTAAVRLVTAEPPEIPWGLWCYRVDRRRSLPGGALTEGGSVFAWMRDAFALPHADAVESELSTMEPDSHGLTILPFWAGERSPGMAAHARATIHGLSLATTPLDIVRAGLESISYRVALLFELLGGLVNADAAVIASGGALLGSPTWLQIMADVLARPVVASSVLEASGRGSALLALEALGAIDGPAEAPEFAGACYTPDMPAHARYREAMERQARLYRLLIGETHGDE